MAWPDGVFWTKFSPSTTMSADPVAGTASYGEKDLDIGDYTNSLNALANGPTVPGTVSFDLRWFPGPQSRRWIYNHPADSQEPDSYALNYWDTTCTLEWEARNTGGFSFSSYKIGQYPAGRKPGQLFAVTGSERSGRFYSPFTSADLASPSSGGAIQGTGQRRLADTGPGVGTPAGAGLLLAGAAMLIRLRKRSVEDPKFGEDQHA